jgi:hypothetical protein
MLSSDPNFEIEKTNSVAFGSKAVATTNWNAKELIAYVLDSYLYKSIRTLQYLFYRFYT